MPLRDIGSRSAARDPLSEALDLAARCGARPLIARVREELKATGARPRRASKPVRHTRFGGGAPSNVMRVKSSRAQALG